MPTTKEFEALIASRDAKIAALQGAVDALLDVQTKTASFVESAHGQLSNAHAEQTKLATFRSSFCEESAKLAGLLESRALIPSARVAELTDKLAENPLHIFDVCRNIAAQVPVPEYGQSAGVVSKVANELTGFERLALDANPSLRARFGGDSGQTNLLDQG